MRPTVIVDPCQLLIDVTRAMRSDRKAEVRSVKAALGLDELEAEFVVALDRGEFDGDIVFTEPMTAEERRRFGLDLVVGEEPEIECDGEAPVH